MTGLASTLPAPPATEVPLCVVLGCHANLVAKVRYVFDTLLMAAGITVRYVTEPPGSGPWLLYGDAWPANHLRDTRCIVVAHSAVAWRLFAAGEDADQPEHSELPLMLPQRATGLEVERDIDFDLVANAFYFLSSWSERVRPRSSRALCTESVYARCGIAQDVVDQYLEHLRVRLQRLAARMGLPSWRPPVWPTGASYALVLSHDVDFLPSGAADVALQGAKTLARHLIRQRDPLDALRAMTGLARACARGRDPYGCVVEIIEREARIGVRSSFQVAVGHRHPNDVNYRIEDDRVRDYLRIIEDSGFDLCLHGSYRSTENADWYRDEVELLARRLSRPRGSRQHFLSFDYDVLFSAQEASGIQYDMSMGFPDRIGPRAGFSHPYFPYSIESDRPYDVVQISLGLMDVTLRSYMHLKTEAARRVIDETLTDLEHKGGCMSMVWHPIVFAGARDPGYDDLYWHTVDRVRQSKGLATDGRTINAHWRDRARRYASFANARQPGPSDRCAPSAARSADVNSIGSLT